MRILCGNYIRLQKNFHLRLKQLHCLIMSFNVSTYFKYENFYFKYINYVSSELKILTSLNLNSTDNQVGDQPINSATLQPRYTKFNLCMRKNQLANELMV